MIIRLPEPIQLADPPDLHRFDFTSSAKANVAAGSFRIQPLMLTDGPKAGVELLIVDTGRVRAAICPTRGMSLWKAVIDGLDCGWDSPVRGPIHPNFVALDESSGLGWLDGFDELLVRCGLRSFGAPDFNDQGRLMFPLHGRIGNSPTRQLQVVADNEHSLLEVRGIVSETRFLQYNLQLEAKYVFAIGEPVIEIHDRVHNAGGTPTTMQMLYHINVGQPMLGAGSKMHIGAERAVARDAHAATDLADWQVYREPATGYEEQVYFFQSAADSQGWAKVQLNSPEEDQSLVVHFQTKTLPYFTQWKNTVAEADGYVTGLEPGTGFPNPRSFEEEKGRLVQLGPGESTEFRLKLEGVSDALRVQRMENEISDLSPGRIELVEFDPEWCVPR